MSVEMALGAFLYGVVSAKESEEKRYGIQRSPQEIDALNRINNVMSHSRLRQQNRANRLANKRP